jgi:hypothetical protein
MYLFVCEVKCTRQKCAIYVLYYIQLKFWKWKWDENKGITRAHTHTQLLAHTHMCTFSHVLAYMHAHILLYTHIHTYVHSLVHSHIHTHIYTFSHTLAHTFAHTYTHIYILLYTRTHTCTHIYTFSYALAHTHTYALSQQCTFFLEIIKFRRIHDDLWRINIRQCHKVSRTREADGCKFDSKEDSSYNECVRMARVPSNTRHVVFWNSPA